jgi:hypothetical protein
LATPTTDKNTAPPALRLQSKSPQIKSVMQASFSYSHHSPFAINTGEFALNTIALGFNIVHLKSQTMIGSRENQHWALPQFCSLLALILQPAFSLSTPEKKKIPFLLLPCFLSHIKDRARANSTQAGRLSTRNCKFFHKHPAIQEQRTKESQPTSIKLGGWLVGH